MRWILLTFSPGIPSRLSNISITLRIKVFNSILSIHNLPSTLFLHFRFVLRLTSVATLLHTSTSPHDYALS